MITPRSESERPGSRLAGAAVVIGLGLLVVSVFVMISFAWPDGDSDDSRPPVLAGSIEDFAPGDPQRFVDSESTWWLVRLEDGSLVALSATDSLSGCEIAWRDDFMFIDPRDQADKAGWFRDPCLGSTYYITGTFVFGPARRDMSRFPVTIDGLDIFVDGARENLTPGPAR